MTILNAQGEPVQSKRRVVKPKKERMAEVWFSGRFLLLYMQRGGVMSDWMVYATLRVQAQQQDPDRVKFLYS